MRWHYARLRRQDTERRYNKLMPVASFRPGSGPLSGELPDTRRPESSYKCRLLQSDVKASDKNPRRQTKKPPNIGGPCPSKYLISGGVGFIRRLETRMNKRYDRS